MKRFLVLAVALGGLVLPSTAGAYVYWANIQTGAIGRAQTDGTGVDQSFITGASFPYGVAVNDSNIFWSNNNQGEIGRAGLDGSHPKQNLVTGANFPYGVAANDSYIYWANSSGGTIGRAEVGGAGVDQSFITGVSGASAVAVDGSHIYWTNSSANSIGRADLNGNNVNQSFITGLSGPSGLAVDASHIYWSNANSNSWTIGRADIDGNNVNNSLITGSQYPSGMAIDGSHIYWANLNGNTIGRADLDGNNVNQSFITGAHTPQAVAVDSFSATPTLSSTASAGGLLGKSIHDTATLANGTSPTGTMGFELFGPDDPHCKGIPLFGDGEPVDSGNGQYQSAEYTPTVAGTYHWVADYSGDATNVPVRGSCGDPNESVKITVKDTTPPQTTIAKQSVNSAKRTAKFTVRSSESGSTFKCSLDGKRFKSCDPKVSYRKLKPGKHVFKARATDKAGNADKTPAKAGFKIKG